MGTLRYKPVQSAFSSMQGPSKIPIRNPVSQVRGEPEKELTFGARKKVRFDPNIKVYEYVSCDEPSRYLREDEGGEKKGKEENVPKSSKPLSSSEDNSITTSSGSYPLIYRYSNWRDTDDEYEELGYEDSDIDDDDYNGGLEGNGFHEEDAVGIVELRSRISVAQVYTEEFDSAMPLYGLNAGEAKPIESNPYTRDRRVSANPLLVPVENLTHWRALKAKGARPLRPVDNLTQLEAIAAHPYALGKSVLGNPLLIPVENITQWKAVKAKGTPPLRPVEKNVIQQKAVKAKEKSLGPVEDPTHWKAVNPLRIPVESLAQWKAVKAEGAPPLKSQKENFVQNQVPRVPFHSEPSVKELSFNQGKKSNQETARRSLGRRPDGMPMIGTVGTYWNRTDPAKYSGSISYYNECKKQPASTEGYI